jgi:hypothetical protein
VYASTLRHLLIGLALCCCLSSVRAQEPRLRLSFSRQNNFTYTTILDFDYEWEQGPYRLRVNFHHDHLLNSARSESPFVQFYIRTSIWQHYQLSKRLALASWIETDQFFNTQNQRYSGYLGVTYKPIPQVEVTPLLGYSWDYRDDRLDQGISPALQVGIRHRWEDGPSMQTDLFLRYKDISPRQQRNFMLQSLWGYEIPGQASLSFGLRAGSNEIDDYRAGAVERIISDTLNPVLNFRYQLLPGLFWDTENQLNLTRRRFTFEAFQHPEVPFNDLSFTQTDLYTLQKLSLSKKQFRAHFSYEYEFVVRRYDLENTTGLSNLAFDKLLEREQQKDYLRNLNALELLVNWRLSNRQELSLVGNNRYLQYDTPSESNFDDHDQLNYGLSLEWKSQWSRKFRTTYKLLGQIRKYAFLYKERSQDNYTQRALRMEFGYRWEPLPRLVFSGEQFIYVTYNVKDFEDRNRTDRSTRNLESRLEARYRPSRKLEVKASYYRKETQVSYLKWETFTETTLDTNRFQILDVKAAYQLKSPWPKTRLFVDGGYKHFLQGRRQNTAMLNEENKLIPINLWIRTFQTGPQTGLRLMLRGGAGIELLVWWQYQINDFKFREVDRFLTLSTSYRQRDLESVNTAFRPFINLKANLLIK